MDDERDTNSTSVDDGNATVPGAAARALAEAEERRALRRRADQQPRPREIDGRQGPEPVRYGDWENKGIASDF